MPAESPYPAPFDTATFIFPAEWHALSDLLGGADTAVLYLRDGTIIHLNEQLADVLGYAPEELFGQSVESLFPSDNIQALPKSQSATPQTSEGKSIRLLAKDGKPVEFRVLANRIDTLHDASCTIWVLHPEHTFGEPADVETRRLQAVAEQQRREAIASTKRQLHYLNRLLRLGLRPQPDIDAALKLALKATAKALGIERAGYWEVKEDPAATQCLMAYDDLRQNAGPEKPDQVFFTVFHPLLVELTKEERRLVVDDVDQDPRTALYCEYFHAASVKSLMIIPVRRDDRVPSLLMLSTVARARSWRKDEVEFAINVAGIIAQTFKEIDRRRTDAQLRHMAHHDSLTGLPNRHFLFDQAHEIFPKVTAKANTLATFFIDLDGFKNVNDSLGHAIGDELLRATALRLKNVVRKDDILVRLGGDEFMLLARNLNNLRIADDIASQIVETMRGPFSLQGRELQISASVGMAMYPFDGTDIETLMKKADIAMYHAKAAGRDRYQTFASPPDDGVPRLSALEAELRRALAENELQHYYQPQIDLRTGKVRCVEALLRWQHPRLGTLLPANFLPAAEESGLIHDISKWVLNDACRQLNEWTAQGLDHMRIAINLSASQLMDRSLLSELENVLERSRIPGHRLEWEIKESTVMQHHTMTSSMLDRMADMQIGLSIDDFGTGYSNMAYLRRYPVRKVKIDSSFINGLPNEGDDRAITDAIISMARPLGLDVVAEGVETTQQVDYLREHGCDIAQGFLFTHPLSAEQFGKWLVRH